MAAGIYDVGRLVATLGLNTAPFMAGASGAVSQMRQIQASMMMTGRAMTRFVTLPMALAGAGAVNMQKNFESSMTKIVGLVGVAQDVVDDWADSILNLAKETGRGPEELADAMYFVASAGIRGAEAMDVLEMSAKAAAVGIGETKVVADLVTSAMNAYKNSNLTAAEAVDVVIASVREGKAEADALASSMGKVLPIASAFGVQFEQVGAAFAAMTRTGTNADIAATQLKAILSQMASPSMQAADAMARFGTDADTFRSILEDQGLIQALLHLNEKVRGNKAAFSEVFPNIRALMGVLDLLGDNMEDNVRIFERMRNSTGSLKTAFEEVQNTTQFKLDKAIASLGVSAITLGEQLKGPVISALQGVTKWLNNITEKFAAMDEAQKKATMAVIALTAAFGPLFVILSRIIAIINTQPWFALATAITLVATAAVTYFGTLKKLRAEQTELQKITKQAKSDMAEQKSLVQSLYQIAKDENVELGKRKQALEELNRISPTYFGDLNTITINTNKATTALKKYNDELLLTSQIKAAEKVLEEVNAEIFKLQDSATIAEEADRGLFKFLGKATQLVKTFGGLSDSVSAQTFAESKVNTLLEQQITKRDALLQQIAAFSKELRKFGPDPVDVEAVDVSKMPLPDTKGYLKDLQEQIQQAQGAVMGATEDLLATRLDDLRVLQEEYKIAQLMSNEYGVLGALQKDIQVAKMGLTRLSGEELTNAMKLIQEKERQLALAQMTADGLGAIEKINYNIEGIQQKINNATEEGLGALKEQVYWMQLRKDVLEESYDPLKAQLLLAKEGSYAWQQHYQERLSVLSGFMKTMESMELQSHGLYMQAAKERFDIEQTLKEKKIQDISAVLSAAQNFASSMNSLLQAQMNAEIKAAGNNAAKKAAIEKAYYEKQKKWAILGAVINTALGITKAFGQLGPIAGAIAAVLVTAAGAAQIATINAQSFAQGGLIYGETLARVGEYPGARSNPEIIAPLDKLKGMLQPQGGSLPQNIEWKLKGRDLVAVIRAEQQYEQTY